VGGPLFGRSGERDSVMDISADRAELTRLDLISLRRVFDAACDELGIGMHSLDVELRERLVQCTSGWRAKARRTRKRYKGAPCSTSAIPKSAGRDRL
jgi:hypothetical protein